MSSYFFFQDRYNFDLNLYMKYILFTFKVPILNFHMKFQFNNVKGSVGEVSLNHAFKNYLPLNHPSTPPAKNVRLRSIHKVKEESHIEIRGTQQIDLMISCFEIITTCKQK